MRWFRKHITFVITGLRWALAYKLASIPYKKTILLPNQDSTAANYEDPDVFGLYQKYEVGWVESTWGCASWV